MCRIIFTKIGLVFQQTILGQNTHDLLSLESLFKARNRSISGSKSVFFPQTVIFLSQGALLYI